jgi:IS30 family transposase
MMGSNGKFVILTVVDRKTNMLMVRLLPKGKNAKALAEALITMLLPYIGHIRSITTDNGSEFAEHLHIVRRLKTKVYFCHPYSAWKKDA